MNASQLAALLTAAREVAHEPEQDRLRWLVDALHAELGTRYLRITTAAIPPDEDQPPASGSACQAASDESAARTISLASLRFADKPAVLGDMRAVVIESLDEQTTLLRVREPSALAWVELQPAPTDPEALAVGLRLILAELEPDPLSPLQQRRAFFDRMVHTEPTGTHADYERICEIWQSVTGADWCWLWMLNRLDPHRSYELTAHARAGDGPRDIPAQRVAPGRCSVGHYACRTAAPVWIENVADWERDLEQASYSVVVRDFLLERAAPSLLCVPLFEGDQHAAPDGDDALTNVISLHYSDPARRVRHDDPILLVMGRLTAMCIARSQERKQHDILVQLNRFAQQYLIETKAPAESRPKYLDELIDLIQSRFGVSYVSVFYRGGFEDAVECIGTTGLRDVATGKPLPHSGLGLAKYAAGERNTGRCFATARPIVTDGVEDVEDLKFSERPAAVEGEFDPSIYIPILDPLRPEGRALGVIRCFDHRSPVFPSARARFDRPEVETLRFIAAQVGPALKSFEQRILRERTISTIKHDLSSPLAMMRDVVDMLIEEAEAGQPPNTTGLTDLRATIRLASNLVDQLDPDPGVVREFHPRATLLEGDIVARLKDMLQSIARDTRRMDIRFDGFRQVPALMVDATLIERAIYNLLLNAIKYGQRNTTIDVRAAALEDGSGYIVDVSNFGIGIEAADEPFVFTSGYRSLAAQRTALGAGLGLPIAEKAMRRHGGSLRLHRRKNPTIFRLFFPADLRA